MLIYWVKQKYFKINFTCFFLPWVTWPMEILKFHGLDLWFALGFCWSVLL